MATTKSTAVNGEQSVETTSLGVLQELEAIRERVTQIQAAQNEAKAKSHSTPSDLAVKDAENRKKIAEAEAAIAKARREQITGAIPDLSSIDTGTLEKNADDPPIGEGFLVYRAIEQAAKQVAEKVDIKDWDHERTILVTNDESMVTGSADYQLVNAGLKSAIDYSNKVLNEVEKLPESELVNSETVSKQSLIDDLSAQLGKDPTEAAGISLEQIEAAVGKNHMLAPAAMLPLAIGALPQIAVAASTLIPPLVSMFSARRTLRSGKDPVQDLAVTAAVVGEMEANDQHKVRVIHDDFRLITSDSGVFVLWRKLSGLQSQLSEKKSTIANGKALIEAELETVKKLLEEASKDLDKATSAPKKEAAKRTVERLRAEVNSLTSRALKLAVGLAKVDTALGTITTLSEGLLTVHEGSQRNLLTTAALREELYGTKSSGRKITHIMLVKAQQSNWSQVIDEMPLWLSDKFSSIISVSITYMLIQLSDQTVVVGGTASAIAEAYGKIGQRINVAFE